ncbi:aminotransferase family protein [Halorubrum vacuolatum]|uniref:Adenosylmethionine-8-amino-7-oxononanoate aminotransferase n=1 Tax=Halorubrum vacuolatum TaxID=63740 RepID=A0A238WZF1_HALVU|nr:aspartate aminotransferase family protein [Halorubrum vacuolatum]SNR51820.1 Adenosylmethionine-8-amino-7-oxononanoate aminotransferase [Halorubrum vacuolatum]
MTTFYKWGSGTNPDAPRVDHAHDEFLITTDGERIIDAASGALVVNLGHSVPGVSELMADQSEAVAYVSTSYFRNDPAERLADRLTELTPDPLSAAFFVGSGSEANETAIKLARAYHLAQGNQRKQTVICRHGSYHGATLGALSLSGKPTRTAPFVPLLKRGPRIPAAYPYRWTYEGTPEEQAIAAARELDAAITREGPETVAAFIAEPVSGSTLGAAHPHPTYYREIRRICDRHDVCFIADEVMTGFGRTGEFFAVDHADVAPDILTVGKGISGGYAPIAAAIVTERIAETFEADSEHAFAHGHTFSANPLSTAVADHVVAQYDEDVLADVRDRGATLRSALAPLTDHPHVGEIRGLGLMYGIELVADVETQRPFDPDRRVSKRIFETCLAEGVYVYPGSGSVDGRAGDHLLLGPPFITSPESIQEIAETVIGAIESVTDESV